MRFLRAIKNKWYYLKCATWNRYNRLHIKTLPPTFIDRCDLLPHAMFQVLDDFITKECNPGVVNWEDGIYKQVRQKMDELLNWWKEVYLRFDSMEGFDESKAIPWKQKLEKDGGMKPPNEYEAQFYKEANRKEDAIEKELIKKMKELVDLQPYLWT